MKKLLLSLLCITMSVMAYASDFAAKSANDTTLYYNYLGGDSVEVTHNGQGTYSGEIVIPSLVNDGVSSYRVASIGDSAFFECVNLQSVDIPDDILTIGDKAFYHCAYLQTINIPQGVSRIGKWAFFLCINLRSHLSLPKGLSSIGYGAFGRCPALTSISVDTENTTYDSRNNCNAIIETASNAIIASSNNSWIPSTVTRIEDYACSDRKHKFIDIPNSVTSIGSYAFYFCSGLTSIKIPSRVINIGNSAFGECINLMTVHCEAITPPELGNFVFKEISNEAILFVPYEAVKTYKAAPYWSTSFSEIKGYVEVIPESETSVDLTWIPIDDVEQYHIMIYEDTTHTSLIREYYVNADGKQVRPQNDGNAPTAHTPNFIIQQKKDTTYSTDELYVLTIEDLSPDVVYSFVIEGCNAEHKVIYHETGTFQTKQPNKDDGVSYLGVNCEWNYVNGELQITEEASSNIYIYTIDGQLIYRKRTSNCTIALPSGLYIIRINGKAQKVVL